MRLFIAIELPEDVRRHLAQVRDAVRSRIVDSASGIGSLSFTRDENLHITLKFLGEVDDKRLVKLIESLSLVRSGGTIDTFAERIECFPQRGPVRIVAAGFGGTIDAMRALHDAIEQRCRHLGFDREARRYRPHVTLARARGALPATIRAEATEAAEELFPGTAMTVTHFALIESRLRTQGSEYRTLHRFPLAGASA